MQAVVHLLFETTHLTPPPLSQHSLDWLQLTNRKFVGGASVLTARPMWLR